MNAIWGFLTSILVFAIMVSVGVTVIDKLVSTGQAESSLGYFVTCYNFSGATVLEERALRVSSGMTGISIKTASGKSIETQFATCVIKEI